MYGLKSQQRLANIDAGVNEFHSHSGQSIPPFGWFHWAALWEICSLTSIVGSALKPRTSSAMQQQALCKNLQGPNQSQTQRLSERTETQSTESLQFCPVSQCIVPQPSHWCFWISAFPTLLDSEVPLHFHTWLAASNSRIRFLAWCPNCHHFSLASTKQYTTKRIKSFAVAVAWDQHRPDEIISWVGSVGLPVSIFVTKSSYLWQLSPWALFDFFNVLCWMHVVNVVLHVSPGIAFLTRYTR